MDDGAVGHHETLELHGPPDQGVDLPGLHLQSQLLLLDDDVESPAVDEGGLDGPQFGMVDLQPLLKDERGDVAEGDLPNPPPPRRRQRR